jgi:hypothetical protein
MNFKYFKHWLKYTSISSNFILIFLAIFQLPIVSAQTQKKGGIDWIVVVDTSASMRGIGGTKNIFEQVKTSINEFINTARLGDTITIYSFDKDVTLNANEIAITSNPDRGKLKQIISSLPANGIRTHTGKAVQKALQHSAVLNQRADALGRTVSIVFLTDGLEDVRGIPNPVSIPSSTQLLNQQQCKPYVFFVSLGLEEHEKQLNEFANNPALCSKGQVLRDPGGVQLNRLAQNIRPVLIQPQLDANLPSANLQPVLPGTTTKPLNINGISNVNATVNLQLEDPSDSGIRLIPPDHPIDLAANQPQAIPIRLQIPTQATGGVHNLRLVLTTTDKAIAPTSVNLPVTVKPQLQFSTERINFAPTEAGNTTQTQTLVVKSNISTTAKLELQGAIKDISLAKPATPVSLQIGETQIPVQLQISDRSSEGKRTFTVLLRPDNSLASPIIAEVEVDILIPLGRKILTWSFLILLLLLIALIAFCLIQRKTPLEIIEEIRTRNCLEGALLILEPQTDVADAEISLTRLHKNKVCLSDLISVITQTDSDAELVLAWRAGKKNIELHCLNGVIFVNTKKIHTEELYDEDIIEIGNVKLQFNWIEHQRPSELSSDQTNF